VSKPQASATKTLLSLLLVGAPAATSGAQNLLANPSFDADVTGWRSDPSISRLTWADLDRHENGDSGSARVEGIGIRAVLPRAEIEQCATVEPGVNYVFGASVWFADRPADLPPPSPVGVEIEVSWFRGANCAGAPLYASSYPLGPVIGTTWMDIQQHFTAADGATSALLTVRAKSFFPDEGVTIHVDDAFLMAGVTCVDTDSVLCLQGGRFQASGFWRIPDRSEAGYMRAVPVTGESGLFWFFSPDNMELMLKVLDGCGAPPNRFWVFAAGMTNIETHVLVADTSTNFTSRQYSSAAGSPYQPVQDTLAFTCP
jgi:hypothetical protein